MGCTCTSTPFKSLLSQCTCAETTPTVATRLMESSMARTSSATLPRTSASVLTCLCPLMNKPAVILPAATKASYRSFFATGTYVCTFKVIYAFITMDMVGDDLAAAANVTVARDDITRIRIYCHPKTDNVRPTWNVSCQSLYVYAHNTTGPTSALGGFENTQISKLPCVVRTDSRCTSCGCECCLWCTPRPVHIINAVVALPSGRFSVRAYRSLVS